MGALIPRTTVGEICGKRDAALSLYAQAWDAIAEADRAIAAAWHAARGVGPGTLNSYNFQIDEACKGFIAPINPPARDKFLSEARRLTDINAWARLVELTDLERLMDKQAKDELRQALMSDPPEVTEGNVLATVETWAGNAGMTFRRGIANCFSQLDRRFRSHDGWKVGSRVILTGTFDEWGHWSYYRNHRDTLTDIERVFLTLDGKQIPPAGYTGKATGQDESEAEPYLRIVDAVDRARGRGWTARQTEVQSDYFTIRAFKNGNCHVWFKRDDLVAKVNQLIGEYYGSPIPEDRAPEDDGGLYTPKTSIAKNYGFYPTPEGAAQRLFGHFPMYRPDGEPPLTVLEPSAGTGNLARMAVTKGGVVDCVELYAERAAELTASGLYRKVWQCNFLTLKPSTLYDRVVMNPPFDRERDIDHVMHALGFLKPDGCLSAIMSAGTEFRETRKSQAFRALMEKMNARWDDLPAGSFASVGTNVNTLILRVRKDGRGWSW